MTVTTDIPGATTKKREVTLQIKEFGGDDARAGTLKGYGSVYGNIDSAGDIMAPGCFAKSINDRTSSGKKFPFLYQHNWDEPIGVIEVIKEDFRGLLIEVQLNLDTQKGRDTYSLVKQGAISGLSVGFLIVKDEVDGRGVRTIREGRLMEVSAVTFPCNEEALISSVKRLEFHGDTKVNFKNSTKSAADTALVQINGLIKAHGENELTEAQFKHTLESVSALLTAIKSATIGSDDEPQKSSDGDDDSALDKSTEAAEQAESKASEDEPQESAEKLVTTFDFEDPEDVEYHVDSEKSKEDDAETMKALQHSIDMFIKGL